MLFLIFINDITDDIIGFGRLFADDTSIGNVASNEISLQNNINSDLTHLKEWSDRWMIKFNPNKTDIMVFNVRGTGCNFSFEFDQTTLPPVNLHKHLRVVFSSDCGWNTHIDKLIESVSKQLNVLRKLKYKLKRKY